MTSSFRFGACELRPASRELIVGGVSVDLQRRAFDLLVHLLVHAGRVVTRDEVLEHVWHRRFVCESVVAKAVMKARRALGEESAGGCIESTRGVGYRFVAPVEVVGVDAVSVAPINRFLDELQRRGLAAADEHRLEIARAYLEVCIDLAPALPAASLPLARRLWQGG
ncbi:hypothetical protein BH10PSE17_BH10PSE17_19760 [soil metagenome]